MEIEPESSLPNVYDLQTVVAPVPGGRTFEKSYECVLCRLIFKERDTVTFRGKRYGVPCGCSRDTIQLASRGT
jgi:hypothetical protein